MHTFVNILNKPVHVYEIVCNGGVRGNIPYSIFPQNKVCV